MPRSLWFRGLILVLILVLVAPSAVAAPNREPEGWALRGVLSVLWQALVELVPGISAGSGDTSSAEGDAHGTMDPNG